MKKILFFLCTLICSNQLMADDVVQTNQNYEKLMADDVVQTNQNYEKSWVQYSNNNSLLFRHLTDDIKKACPVIKIDNIEKQTIERTHDYNEEFPIKICQTEIDNKKNHNIVFDKFHVNTKIENINKISVMGDTGCITEGEALEQNCKKLEEYPFSEITKNISQSKADLIIHVGDYFYSKDRCLDDAKCQNRPYGDKIETWKVDFIDNASQFFDSAPIIFTRGNHEACERGGKGWFVLFDSSINFKKCELFTDPFLIEFKNLRFLMLDSTYAPDSETKFYALSDAHQTNTVTQYQNQIDNLLSKITTDKQNVLITHRPAFSREYRPWQSGLLFETNYLINKVINSSQYKGNLKNLELILSGHTHTGMLIEFKDTDYHFYQAVIGNSGAFLNKAMMVQPSDKEIFNKKIASVFEYKDFGYAELYLNKKDKIENIKFFKYDGVLVGDKKLTK